jgi:hypothetical protein
MPIKPWFTCTAILFVSIVLIALLGAARSAAAQDKVLDGCFVDGNAASCSDSTDSADSSSSGGCNVICAGIRGLLGIPNEAAPSGPSPAQIQEQRREQIEADQQRQLSKDRGDAARFSADRDAAAQELKGVGGVSGLKTGDGTALHQLPSAALTSDAASQFGDTAPAKDLSSCGFDDAAGCATATPVTVPKISGAKTAGVAALLDRLPPEAKKDPDIKQNIAFITKLEGRKTDKQQQLAEIKHEIDQGGGDATVLAAKKGTLENDLKQIDNDEQTATDQIGKRMADRGLAWNEGK